MNLNRTKQAGRGGEESPPKKRTRNTYRVTQTFIYIHRILRKSQAVVAYTYDPSIQDTEAGRCL